MKDEAHVLECLPRVVDLVDDQSSSSEEDLARSQPLRSDNLRANHLLGRVRERFVKRETNSLNGDILLGSRVLDECTLFKYIASPEGRFVESKEESRKK